MKQEQLCYGNEDEHNSHTYIHARSEQISQFGIAMPPVPDAEINREQQHDNNKNKQADLNPFQSGHPASFLFGAMKRLS